ncbi:MAG TPA: aromatic-ring-hydroxylating dioxygenase subunit beta [Candidatus Tectomicrobia bacterium]|jgi:3-phenylpropionate/cinnamic acid dioxygenase small subunit|nr:aromatic-ring-hydroxylating dioxygenase subunit beta [Candidatus Tectomicrobia bacterium]
MTTTEGFLTMSRRDLRLELEELYAEYVACLDEERLEEWPEFFTDDAVYRIIPRENFERGLPIATLHCESKGYLKDRVIAIRQTSVYAPRYVRRLVSNIRVLGWRDEALHVRANYAAFETLRDELTRVFSVGRCHDTLVVADGRLKFKEKLVIFDSELIPNSLIYPL